ncbi:MAG: DUF7459 domain-containing protein [Mycobacterium sp.]
MYESQKCQHHRINSEGKCVECDAQMLAVTWETETVLSAPNLAGCSNPACKQALADGTYDETDPPAGCTNPSGTYIPGRATEVPIGHKVTYQCDRCEYGPGTTITPDMTMWDCGQSHQGEYVPIHGRVSA